MRPDRRIASHRASDRGRLMPAEKLLHRAVRRSSQPDHFPILHHESTPLRHPASGCGPHGACAAHGPRPPVQARSESAAGRARFCNRSARVRRLARRAAQTGANRTIGVLACRPYTAGVATRAPQGDAPFVSTQVRAASSAPVPSRRCAGGSTVKPSCTRRSTRTSPWMDAGRVTSWNQQAESFRMGRAGGPGPTSRRHHRAARASRGPRGGLRRFLTTVEGPDLNQRIELTACGATAPSSGGARRRARARRDVVVVQRVRTRYHCPRAADEALRESERKFGQRLSAPRRRWPSRRWPTPAAVDL